MSQILEQSSQKRVKRPKIYRSTKSLTCPSRSESSPLVYLQLVDMQYEPIWKKAAASASSTILKSITFHLGHWTSTIIMRKLPTKKTIYTGKAIMVISCMRFPGVQMTKTNPTKPKALATCTKKMLSKRIQRLNIFHLSFVRESVVMTETRMMQSITTIDMMPLFCSFLVNTSSTFWKERQKEVSRLIKYMKLCCSFRDVIAFSSISPTASSISSSCLTLERV